jgi:hypothetical protein
MKPFITFFFKHFGLKNFMYISAIIGFLANQFFSLINTCFYILIIMYQIIIMYFLFSLCEAVYNYINVKLSLKKFELQYRRVYNGATVLEGTILFPMGIVALIGKIIGSFYLDHADLYIWNQDIKYVFIVIIVGLFLNLLLDNLNNKDSSVKPDTKTKQSVPVIPEATGGNGSAAAASDKSSEDKKSWWDKLKKFYFDHQYVINMVVILGGGIYIYIPLDRYYRLPRFLNNQETDPLIGAEVNVQFLNQIKMIIADIQIKQTMGINAFVINGFIRLDVIWSMYGITPEALTEMFTILKIYTKDIECVIARARIHLATEAHIKVLTRIQNNNLKSINILKKSRCLPDEFRILCSSFTGDLDVLNFMRIWYTL